MPQLDLGKVVGDTGPQGPKGDQGIQGPAGQTGPGVAVGGSANQVLVKHSGTNYDTQWVDAGNLPSIAGVQNAVAIVANGDTHPAIASGQFVYVRNHSTLAEGLYKATAAIGTDVALTTSNLTPDNQGGLNKLKGDIDSLNSNLETNVNLFKTQLNSNSFSGPRFVRLNWGTTISFNLPVGHWAIGVYPEDDGTVSKFWHSGGGLNIYGLNTDRYPVTLSGDTVTITHPGGATSMAFLIL